MPKLEVAVRDKGNFLVRERTLGYSSIDLLEFSCSVPLEQRMEARRNRMGLMQQDILSSDCEEPAHDDLIPSNFGEEEDFLKERRVLNFELEKVIDLYM